MEILTINNVWMMTATFLVFIMHLGFATLESGLTRSKNTINIIFKNVMIISIGILTYTLAGFNLMYPGDNFAGSFFGFAGFGLSIPANGLTPSYADGGYTFWTDFLFQAMFAATAATIVSGAVAERIKLNSFLLFTLFYIGLVYPIVGMWKWGGGFLESWGFHDFAGSSLVHSVGGWAALIAIILLKPRLGKYVNGEIKPIEGHNIPLATIGVFLLWLGWFGFNGGSVLSANPGAVSKVLVTTTISAAAGAIGAYVVSYLKFKSFDITMVLNGILAGLVGITAGADLMSVTDTMIIGFIAGIIIVLTVVLLDKIRLDDPVGATAVHLACGIWGTLAVGILGDKANWNQFLTQLSGVAIIGLFCCFLAFVILFIIKKTIGLRVSKKIEIEGLDIHEHGMNAYPDFRLNQH